MINITEIALEKYKKGKTPSEGKIVWSCAMENNIVESKMQAIYRLTEYIKTKDKNRHEYFAGDYVKVLKMGKNGAFNDKGEIIYKKSFSGNPQFHKRAVQRLARYLSKRDKKYNYYGQLALFERGENCYIVSTRSTYLLDDADKEKMIKLSIRGQKASLIRNINKAKKIRENYARTLLPDGYKTDKRYLSLVSNLYNQKRRLHEKRRKKVDDIATISGGLITDISKIKGL